MADFALTGPKWPSLNVTWTFEANNFPGQPGGNFSGIFIDTGPPDPSSFLHTREWDIYEAFDEWSQATGLHFTHIPQLQDSPTVNIRLGYYHGDGPNGTIAKTNPAAFMGAFSTIDIFFDDTETYTLNSAIGDFVQSGGIPFMNTVLHEIGHALGLAHYDGAPAVMNTNANSLMHLTAHEINGVRYLYYGVLPPNPGIVFQNDNGAPAVWTLNGTSLASMGPVLANPGPSWHAKATADFSDDGSADILWQNDNGQPAVWLLNGTSVSSYGPGLANPGPSWHAKEAADFNGDGKADILWQNDSGMPAVWLMNGTGVSSFGPGLANPGPAWHEMAAADFNGDGKADILWQNDNGMPAVWLMNGTSVTSFGPGLANPGPAWHEMAAADFNGDGKADILWQNDNGAPAIWLMNGTSVLSYGPALANPGTAWHVKEAMDFSGDGNADILWQNDNGATAVWLMNGTGISSFGPPLPNAGSAWHIV
jgi:hypothetical protein